ncbi:hypothetical protein B0H10DRAFT_2122823, partial [Mycena sp. CBHHK59/15]
MAYPRLDLRTARQEWLRRKQLESGGANHPSIARSKCEDVRPLERVDHQIRMLVQRLDRLAEERRQLLKGAEKAAYKVEISASRGGDEPCPHCSAL